MEKAFEVKGVEYIEKQPSLEEIFPAIVGKRPRMD